MARPRGEAELEDLLKGRGLRVVPQVVVARDDPSYGDFYRIDWVAPDVNLAIELYCGDDPVGKPHLKDRTSVLMSKGFAVVWLWVRRRESINEAGANAIVEYAKELAEGRPERFRMYGADGWLLMSGNLAMSWYLATERAPRREPEWDEDGRMVIKRKHPITYGIHGQEDNLDLDPEDEPAPGRPPVIPPFVPVKSPRLGRDARDLGEPPRIGGATSTEDE